MKRILTIALLLAASVLGASAQTAQPDTAAATRQNAMPTEFFGCRLGSTGRQEAAAQLESRKLNVTDYDGSIVVRDAVLGGFRFSAAMLDFDELGVMSCITYLNSGLSRQEAIDFASALHSVLDSRYITIKRVLDGLDCYFASVGGVTCQLATVANGSTYYVSLSYQLGTAELK